MGGNDVCIAVFLCFCGTFVVGHINDLRHKAELSDDNPYHDLIVKLRDELKKMKVISRVEYVGSAYKGTRIDASDMDNLFVKRDDSITAKRFNTYPAYVHLHSFGTRLQPDKALMTFKGRVQNALTNLGLEDVTKLVDHGPAIELRYYPSGAKSAGKPTFSVDLVFCYELDVGGGQYKMYVAKPPKDAANDEEDSLWKRSTAIEEKKMMSKIDKRNTVGRWAIRILKDLRDQESTLKVLTSYTVEQNLFRQWEQQPMSFWKEDNMKEILRFLLLSLADAVEKNELLNYFNPDENVMPKMDSITRGNVVNRLRRLAKDPQLDEILGSLRDDKHEEL